jgi:hypothetical protein
MSPFIEDNKIKMLAHLRSTPNSHEEINSTTALSVNVSSQWRFTLYYASRVPIHFSAAHGARPRRVVTS